MLTIVFSEPVTHDRLYKFADQYWQATHPIERTKMGACAVGGLRNEAPLTQAQKAEITSYAKSLGLKDDMIVYSDNMNTGYADLFGRETFKGSKGSALDKGAIIYEKINDDRRYS